MGISAADVKALREKTGAGMMDCKKALVKADGDADKAEKILKELGLAAAAKRSGRATDEGRVFAQVKDGKAGLLEISCETDFVARNDDFIKTGNEILLTAMTKELDSSSDELAKAIEDLRLLVKENINLKKLSVVAVKDDEYAIEYVHGEGRIGVVVKLAATDASVFEKDEVKEYAFNCALHIAAYNPMYLDEKSVDPAYLKEQEEIFTKQAENLGKPEKVLKGIVQGKLKKHLSEICFLNQPFVKDDKRTVAKVAEDLSKETGSTISVKEYTYFGLGQ